MMPCPSDKLKTCPGVSIAHSGRTPRGRGTEDRSVLAALFEEHAEPEGADEDDHEDREEFEEDHHFTCVSLGRFGSLVSPLDLPGRRRLIQGARCLPAQTGAREVLRLEPDGVFLSNGPGDPEPCDYAIEAIGEILDATRVPVFGICLGHQLMGLASGAKTMKMKFGHHGANHPVKDLDTGRVVITSQNHGFAVDPASIGTSLRPTHVSLFDGSLQGLARTDRPAFCFQGHPEASPGPHDIGYLFDRFAKLMEEARA
jgi:anthranilate/para-aminobenzoate synthase component II